MVGRDGSEDPGDVITDTTPAATDPVFDTSTAAGRLRILWGATVNPDLVMTDNDVADVATVLDEHAEMAAELERLRAERVEARAALSVAAEMLDRFAADTPCTEGGDICREHGYVRKPCVHPLARQFVTAWRAVEGERA